MDDSGFLNNAKYAKIIQERAKALQPDLEAPEGESSTDDFLKRIAGIESSSGKDTAHRTILEGIHAGDAAQGQYGLMPQTAIDLSKKLGNKDTELGRYTQGMDMPDIKALANLPKESLMAQMDKPEIERKLARLLATEVSLKQGGDERKMAEAWNKGSNIPQERMTEERLDSSPYVKKFDKLGSKSMNLAALDLQADSGLNMDERLTKQMAKWLSNPGSKEKLGL